MRPAGLDRQTARRVRRDVLQGRRVDDPALRPAAEFYADRIGRLIDLQFRLHPLHIVVAVIFAAIVVASLATGSFDDPWFAVFTTTNAVIWTFLSIFGPSLWRRRRACLVVNQPGADKSA